jgi:hypothetical protein
MTTDSFNPARIRVCFDPYAQAWTAYCPCCAWGDICRTWAAALRWADRHHREEHPVTACLFCIDGQMPTGRDELLGELFERCPVCTPACLSCQGLAVYPAKYDTPIEMAAELAAFDHYAVLCAVCHGVTDLIPFAYPEDLP